MHDLRIYDFLYDFRMVVQDHIRSDARSCQILQYDCLSWANEIQCSPDQKLRCKIWRLRRNSYKKLSSLADDIRS